MIRLTDAPPDKCLKIIRVVGGHGIRRKLLSLGFHKDDIIELDSRSIFRGPILIRGLTSDTAVALGRGIAHNIMVEIVGDKK